MRLEKEKWVADSSKGTKRPPVKIPQGDTAALIGEHKLTLTASHKDSQSRQTPQAQRTEWRPVASGSQRENPSKSLHSIVSHTPSPRTQREGGSLNRTSTLESRRKSGNGSATSQERRSALEHLSLPEGRIPLLQDGVANAESGRLQKVDIQLIDEIISPNFPGGSNILSGSRNPTPTVEEHYDPNQTRSPIRGRFAESSKEEKLQTSYLYGCLTSSGKEENREKINSKLPRDKCKEKENNKELVLPKKERNY
ncbi:unnamed protein product [Eruca vesicaria subsp. sativa]|uniref:Uncharacterized protein n=1 Tax=Eruca vesicaria subsp. sativa TaxID=29727 RepID=A0ABC8L253_ERUVS|nr:unnamed protein product [Eruca vesicaria subsp. sativa]